jgi:hypothetical protein
MKDIRFILLTVLLCGGYLAGAQQVEFRASAKTVVATGERFTVKYVLNAEGTNFKGPATSDFSIISGPNASTSSSIQIINGRVDRSVEYTYTYLMTASKEGTFTLPAASVKVEGKAYQSNALTIQVIKGPSGQQYQGQQGTASQQKQGVSGDDVFIKAYLDKSNPVQGEQVIVTYKIYTRVPVSQIEIKKLSSFSGFWSKSLLDDDAPLKQYKETINGEEYVVADFRKIALFPLKSGELSIDPLELNCVAQVQQKGQKRWGDPFFDNFFNDSFFNRYQNVQLALKSNPLTIRVAPLPSAGKPADFSGAVGTFRFNSSLDKTSLKTNEAINLKFTVSGKGNIELVEDLKIKFPPDFEVYDPKINNDLSITAAGISGTRTLEYLIIPRTPGKFRIDPVKFSYFDLDRREYVTLSSQPYTIDVEKGEGSSSNITYSGVNQEDIQYIGSDVRHIKTGRPALKLIGASFFGSTLYYLLLVIPLLLFVLFIVVYKNELKKRSNISLMRNLKATKIATKRLRMANKYLREKKKEEFYIEISQALWGYLSDKFTIPQAELSMDSIQAALTNKGIEQPIIDQFMEVLGKCEFARFAPGDSTEQMEMSYTDAMEIISKVERELK